MHETNRQAGLPAQLGDFQILAQLGSGGTGVVYRARWGHREVALKVLQPDLELTQRERERFFAEAQCLSAIQHPSVVKIMGTGALPDGRPYLAMELIAGQTLSARLHRGPLTVEHSLALFRQLAGAVEALHAQGLVHRDLKPENIMLLDGEHHVVLLDFGIAKELHAPDSTVTQEGSVRGSPAYMAPERFFGRPAGHESDIYELGVVLYVMLAGRLPWDRHDDPSGRLGVPPLSSHGVHVPAEVETTLLQALSTRAETRPRSAAEFAQQVGAGDASTPPAKRMTTDLRTPGQPVAPEQPTHHNPQLSAHPEQPKKTRAGAWLLGGAVVIVLGAIVAVLLLTRSESSTEPVASGAEETQTATSPESKTVNPSDSAKKEAPTWPLADESATDAFFHAPADTHFLAVVRFGALRRHPQFGPLITGLREYPQYNIVSTITKSCGADAIDDVSWFFLAVADPAAEHADLAMQTRLGRQKLEDCMASYIGKLETEGPITLGPDGEPVFGWISDTTVVASTRPAVDRQWLGQRVAGKQGLDMNSYGGLLGHVDRTAPIYFAGAGQMARKSGFELDIAPSFVAGHIKTGGDLSAKFVMRYESEKIAEQAAAELAKIIKRARRDNAGVLDTLRSVREGSLVTVEVDIRGLYVGMIAGLIKSAI